LSGCSGRGEAIGHAGELLQGAVRRQGVAEPFLITLPAPCLRSEAVAEPAGTWSINPHWRTKALRSARIAANHWRYPRPLAIAIQSTIPVARGFGSSTADCVAAVRALADLVGHPCTPAELATIVQQAERASDSTMFGITPIAFLPKRGEPLEHLPGEWPSMHIPTIDLGGPPTDTLTHPRPQYTGDELDEFAHLLAIVRTAFAAGDPWALAQAATRSAEIQQRHRPHPRWPELLCLAAAARAYGTAISHSGTAAALLSAHPIEISDSFAYELSGTDQEPTYAHPTSRRR
jgi:uncharacterized protein involved in propanediol utilization